MARSGAKGGGEGAGRGDGGRAGEDVGRKKPVGAQNLAPLQVHQYKIYIELRNL